MKEKSEMTVNESLALITETMNNSRKAILRNSAKHFVLWGCVLMVLSFTIWQLWSSTGNPAWNFLWFAMPLIGYPLALVLTKKDEAAPQSEISRMIGYVWTAFGAFAMSISAIAVFAVPMHITLLIVVMLGLAESISGVLLKNWPIIICGFILGVGGAVAAMLWKSEAQLLLFTLGGLLLVVTGLIVKFQYK
ncbi:MAG: hypothetical protein IKH95_08250 [Bacteroidaceae bacterium]|nr:hypothetical protein [Bacteroidaceae bacterium]